ncbi:MAG: ribosome maturation factor RimP [Myxococcota bacterium]
MLKEDELRSKLFELIEPILENEYGLELVEIHLRREKEGYILRLFVDEPSLSGKVSLDTITEVSRHLSDFLDVEDLIPYSYRLEVSSPGFDRPLRTARHFAGFCGNKVRVRLKDAAWGKRNVVGRLSASGEKGITVEVEGDGAVEITYEQIKSANLVYEWSR